MLTPGNLLFAATIAAAVCANSLTSDALAQAKTSAKITDKILQASDGVPIAITYYQSTLGKDGRSSSCFT